MKARAIERPWRHSRAAPYEIYASWPAFSAPLALPNNVSGGLACVPQRTRAGGIVMTLDIRKALCAGSVALLWSLPAGADGSTPAGTPNWSGSFLQGLAG